MHDGHPYSLPPDAIGLPGTWYLYHDRVRIIAGRFSADRARQFQPGDRSILPEHRAERVAAVSVSFLIRSFFRLPKKDSPSAGARRPIVSFDGSIDCRFPMSTERRPWAIVGPHDVTMRSLLISAMFVSLCAVVAAKQRPEVSPRSFPMIQASVPQAVQMRGIREVQVRWRVVASPSQPSAQTAYTVTRLRERVHRGALRRERRPEFSADALLVVSVTSDGREIDWRLQRHPLVMRAETPGADGQLRGTSWEADVSELSIRIPDLPDIRFVDIYLPRWTGSEFVVNLVARIELSLP